MKEQAEQVLKKTYKRRENITQKVTEPPWINDEIRKKISQRRNMNKRKRNAETPEVKEEMQRLYKEKKNEVQTLIKEEIYKHERKITDEIKNSSEKGKRIWEHINKLKGKTQTKEEDHTLYDDDGNKMSEQEMISNIKGILE
ncbi:hypothetical protein Pcinc_004102 [Petrolisthes cinctipes]|uniref:Uncharacterized protein n=1 Tax=Petrolisthes cinctipes TaxID=88211 RepID=A0AAE1F529_PETCI|nr:hypothetical protein Pcinc_027310 [Petrolisthes cinctipes]KAK3873721.1 hypothetical protein Pcinc_021285 [Petrolisthes cinctipes]KAK3892135.1 hypothetical protein Pcinc_004102 [Petrolisthes cinctipes]